MLLRRSMVTRFIEWSERGPDSEVKPQPAQHLSEEPTRVVERVVLAGLVERCARCQRLAPSNDREIFNEPRIPIEPYQPGAIRAEARDRGSGARRPGSWLVPITAPSRRLRAVP
jgi:hypothetical protein